MAKPSPAFTARYRYYEREELIAEIERLHKLAYFTIKVPKGFKWLSNG